MMAQRGLLTLLGTIFVSLIFFFPLTACAADDQNTTPWHTYNDGVHIYNFNISWVRANPDGMAERDVIGINGRWPIPTMEASIDERIIVNVQNHLEDESTTLHFHGLFLQNETHMDGPGQVTQCPIPPGGSFTYNFTVHQPGVYWYHSHVHAQYPDGLRGPLIITEPNAPFQELYNETKLITVSDWYHDRMPGLIKQFMSKGNPTGAEPVPNSALLGETQNLTVHVTPGATYRIDMVNIGAFASQYIWFEGHNVSVIMIDGVYTHLTETNMIYLAAAQRCSFLITIKDDETSNFPFVASMDLDLFDQVPEDLNWNVTGWMVVDQKKSLPDPAILYEPFSPLDDTLLLPWDNQTLLAEPDHTVTLNVIMDNLGDGANYAFFNNITYVAPKVPTLYTALSAGDLATDPTVYGTNTHTFVLKKDEIVQIILNNIDPGKHPFHLHGHNFQVVWRSDDEAGTFEDSNITAADFAPIPMRRDTAVLHPNGNMVLRFKADNPGVWLFHCHIEWHVQSGLIATFVEAPKVLQEVIKIPEDHFATCEKGQIPIKGNAAGNSVDWLDLDGENAPPPRLPAGFTKSGIVALVFSCISGILGVATVSWYGFAESEEERQAQQGLGISEDNSLSPGDEVQQVSFGNGGLRGGEGNHAGALLRQAGGVIRG